MYQPGGASFDHYDLGKLRFTSVFNLVNSLLLHQSSVFFYISLANCCDRISKCLQQADALVTTLVVLSAHLLPLPHSFTRGYPEPQEVCLGPAGAGISRLLVEEGQR